MVWIITQQDLDAPRVSDRGIPENGAANWHSVHTRQGRAWQAFWDIPIGPRDELTIIEVDTLAGTFKAMMTRGGPATMNEWVVTNPLITESREDREAADAHAARVADAKAQKLGLA